ncbi:hypothetical protein BJX68DRAFT_197149 [Aspergillus pseudodeflectus]|uniref:Uncharacterized protein n=1 Tax=Aspergillus pseudodeflectus TaxID=176178 RepID=A0ABR4JKS0_9EURO
MLSFQFLWGWHISPFCFSEWGIRQRNPWFSRIMEPDSISAGFLGSGAMGSTPVEAILCSAIEFKGTGKDVSILY